MEEVQIKFERWISYRWACRTRSQKKYSAQQRPEWRPWGELVGKERCENLRYHQRGWTVQGSSDLRHRRTKDFETLCGQTPESLGWTTSWGSLSSATTKRTTAGGRQTELGAKPWRLVSSRPRTSAGPMESEMPLGCANRVGLWKHNEQPLAHELIHFQPLAMNIKLLESPSSFYCKFKPHFSAQLCSSLWAGGAVVWPDTFCKSSIAFDCRMEHFWPVEVGIWNYHRQRCNCL